MASNLRGARAGVKQPNAPNRSTSKLSAKARDGGHERRTADRFGDRWKQVPAEAGAHEVASLDVVLEDPGIALAEGKTMRVKGGRVERLLVVLSLVFGVCEGCRADRSPGSEPAAAASSQKDDAVDGKDRGAPIRNRREESRTGSPGQKGRGAEESPAGEGFAGPPPAAASAAGGYASGGVLVPGGAGGGLESVGEKPAPGSPEARIDPNGRFATTYRPGGGHLAAFESAVARGIIPQTERDLVADVGARYVSPMDEPAGKALAIKAEMERTAMQPGGGPTHMRLSLRSTSKAPAGRPHLSVHLVLDVSGSMRGEPIAQARAAARSLVDRLAPTDDFSLVTFSSDADVKVPDGPVGPRRAAIRKTIDDIREGGGTNIGAGLQLAYRQAHARGVPNDAVRVVLLLSDGRANSGITDPSRLSRLALDAFQQGVQTSTFGLGSDYDGVLMSGIASDGAGGYYYLRDAEQIASALATELDKRLDPVATAVEIRVRLKPDVGLLRVYGSRRLNADEAARVRAIEVAADEHAAKHDGIKRDRQDDTEGGMRFLIPAFARDDNHAMLFKLDLPKGVGSRQIATIEIRYKDRVAKKNVADEMRVSVDYANSDADSATSVQPSVARTVQGFAAGESLIEASNLIAAGNSQRAVAILAEREQILRQAAETLNEPGFLQDASRLARLRSHVGSGGPVSDPLVLAMLLETAGRTHLH
jgi:Ca-activated chloride channel family protein